VNYFLFKKWPKYNLFCCYFTIILCIEHGDIWNKINNFILTLEMLF